MDHKEKSHPGELPQNRISEEKEHSRQYEQIEDIITHEALKNRVKADEIPLNSYTNSINLDDPKLYSDFIVQVHTFIYNSFEKRNITDNTSPINRIIIIL